MVSLRLISAMVLVYCTIVTANPASDAWFMKEMQELVEAKEQMDELIDEGEPMAEEYDEEEEYEGEEKTPWMEEEYEHDDDEFTEANDFNDLMESMVSAQQEPQHRCASCGGTGETRETAGISCKAIKEKKPDAESGMYFLQGLHEIIEVYCDMGNDVCGGESGGWMRIADIDMRRPLDRCPNPLRKVKGETLCEPRPIGGRGGCTSPTKFRLHGIKYTRICGKIRAYQKGSTDAFGTPFRSRKGYRGVSIDGPYVDGISLTQGRAPRFHIWTFASALNDLEKGFRYALCPCTRKFGENERQPKLPPFVNVKHLFCDTANQFGKLPRGQTRARNNIPRGNEVFNNPLWDGEGCSADNDCCKQKGLPWFSRTLAETCNDVEMRVCNDEGTKNENTLIEEVDIYVQ